MIGEIVQLDRVRAKVACELLLPKSGRISLTDWGLEGTPSDPYLQNHNVFRLDAVGNVIWQIKRSEGAMEETFGKLRRAADRGETDPGDGYRSGIEPFMDFVLAYPDGSTNLDPNTGSPPDIAIWEPGCIVRLRSFSGWPYILDIERGIATNVATGPIRPW